MVKMRTAAQAFREIKAIDPETSISERQIREIMKSGMIPVFHQGRKTMTTMEALNDFFEHPENYATVIAS